MTALVVLPLLNAVLTSAVAVASLPTTSSINIDIHLPVLPDAYDRVLAANEYLNEKLSSDGVDFQTTDTPHITLFVLSGVCGVLQEPALWRCCCAWSHRRHDLLRCRLFGD
jgi:hypothetical protein